MVFEEALLNHLKNNIDINQKVNGRIYPLVIPQKSEFPVITYTKVSGERLHSLSGDTGATRPFFQISCWADRYSDVKDLAQKVRFCLQNHSGKIGGQSGVNVSGTLLDSESEGYDAVANKYYIHLDFQFYYIEKMGG